MRGRTPSAAPAMMQVDPCPQPGNVPVPVPEEPVPVLAVYPTLPCPALSCPALPCPTLPYPTLPHPLPSGCMRSMPAFRWFVWFVTALANAFARYC
eukprot:gene12980-biopygen7101